MKSNLSGLRFRAREVDFANLRRHIEEAKAAVLSAKDEAHMDEGNSLSIITRLLYGLTVDEVAESKCSSSSVCLRRLLTLWLYREHQRKGGEQN